jgi:hypothetical protein
MSLLKNKFESFSDHRDQNKNDWLTTKEAAFFIRALTSDNKPCVNRIRNLVYEGRLPFYKPFGRLLFKKSELQVLIESSRNGGMKWR